MAEGLRWALAGVVVIAGWALIGYAGYLHYVALPEEHTQRRVIMRAALASGGVGLLLLGTALIIV